jgi:hypothetical protein
MRVTAILRIAGSLVASVCVQADREISDARIEDHDEAITIVGKYVSRND